MFQTFWIRPFNSPLNHHTVLFRFRHIRRSICVGLVFMNLIKTRYLYKFYLTQGYNGQHWSSTNRFVWRCCCLSRLPRQYSSRLVNLCRSWSFSCSSAGHGLDLFPLVCCSIRMLWTPGTNQSRPSHNSHTLSFLSCIIFSLYVTACVSSFFLFFNISFSHVESICESNVFLSSVCSVRSRSSISCSCNSFSAQFFDAGTSLCKVCAPAP